MLCGEVTAKCDILFRLRGTEPKNLSQIGNHRLESIPTRLRRQPYYQLGCGALEVDRPSNA